MIKIPFDLRPATIYDKNFMMHLEKVTWVKFLEEDPENEIDWDDEYSKEYYEKSFRPKYVSIIEHLGQSIGAFSVMFKRKEIIIIYLYVLPEYIGGGIRESLIRDILKKAKEDHKPVKTCAYRGENIEKELCVRMGFEVFRKDGTRDRMIWVPP